MMHPTTTTQALGQARLAEWHHQAQHDALARAARQARHWQSPGTVETSDLVILAVRRAPGRGQAWPARACCP